MSSAGMTILVAVRLAFGVGVGVGFGVGVGRPLAVGWPVETADGEPAGGLVVGAPERDAVTAEGDAVALNDGSASEGNAITVGGGCPEATGASVGPVAGCRPMLFG